ncbi:V-type ATP synthase subunit I [Vagococcus carniphilus]|uniref:V-type ATP synthase subunit I n=1 Tax=Vagococcus carniphilus TaxID=218144 RepID=A0AAW8U8L8_9ENTE|nr:V-type ATP synthase subunit I [Vagococcus carniphilus]MDT2831791.1 V-type ATP synthase subunit I [Vagococcus carniphilus]MDT2834129.1 V-type ATP synthase subunit I [Vagococcus carniphilus]MDT2840644.1 V-type ATP synthase subunit I [Vagococcus carniphilus]MDT2855301.1 V-type ATP synthase subunit I [Vagococcus carniphilus]MDT2866141.1 V-type ATP synthase subunit I [Vagococcus carniphilus]
MAISKMEKVTIISPKCEEEKILRIMQDLQNIEMVDSVTELNNQYQTKQFDVINLDENRQKEDELNQLQSRIQKALNYLSVHISKAPELLNETQTFSEFEKELDFETIQDLLNQVNNWQQKEKAITDEIDQIRVEIENLRQWQYLTINPNETKESKYLRSVLVDFSLTVKETLLEKVEEFSTLFEVVYESQSRQYAFIVFLEKDEELMKELVSTYGLNVMDYAYDQAPKEVFESLETRLVTLKKEKEEIIKQVSTQHQMVNPLKMAEESVLAEIDRIHVKEMLAEYKDLTVIRGWIESDRAESFEKNVRAQLTSNLPVLMTFDETTQTEDVPTALKNNKLVKPFESLTEMYSLPKYGELDPTPLLTPFYMVFFGMMVADVGYGLLMLVGTLLLSKKKTLRRGVRNFISLFKILSVPVMIWGLIYGSFFGLSLPFHVLSPTEDMNSILILSVCFGMIQLLVGLLINGIQLVKKKDYLKSVSESFAWQGILIGAVLLVLGNIVLKNEGLKNAGLILFVISSVLIILVPMITNKSKGKGLAQGVYSFYGITGYIGDLVSYTRLMALGISGGSIAGAFNMLVGFMPPVAKFTVGIALIIVLHALNIFLSLLSAYVHGARLQYVEYFGKFFQGGGRKFSPFKPKEKHIDFKVDK